MATRERLETMSEEAKESSPEVKKKGKFPIIVILLVLIAGGGFFGMKMKGGGAPKKVEIKASPETVAFDKEFLVNLSGNSVYLRAEISLELREDFKKESLDPYMPEIKNAVIQIFRSKKPEQVTAEHTEELQKEIGEEINTILAGHMTEEQKKAQAEFDKVVAQPKADDRQASADPKASGNVPDPFECPAGPVLNVFFTSFTTQ